MKKLLLLILSIFIIVMLVGCQEEDDGLYEIKLKITDGTNEWIFEPDETRKTYEMEYSGEETKFTASSFLITSGSGSPSIEGIWLSLEGVYNVSVNTLHNTLDDEQIEYRGGTVKDKGEYWIYFYARPNNKWKSKQMLFVVNVV